MAFSIAWNEAYPANSDAAAAIGTYIQQDKIATRERLESLLGITDWATRDPMTADTFKTKTLLVTTKLGYDTSAGGTVTQATSKSTGVTLNKVCGDITMHNALLGSFAKVAFTLTNSVIAAGDFVNITHQSAGTAGDYYCWVSNVGAGTCVVNIRNLNPSTDRSEAIVLRFYVFKVVSA